MKSILSHIILVGLLCVMLLTGYSVWYVIVEKKSVAVADLESQISAKTQTESRINAIRASLAEIAGDEASLQSYFVPETGVVSFIDDLEGRGKALGTTVNVLSVSAGGTTALPSFTLALSIDGTFDAVMRTVGAIEYAPYDLSISTLSVAQDAKNKWHADLNVSVGSMIANTATSTP
ncbi:MAG: hypothetical protein KGH79_04985 [Patescibacteria group bacterium]|nr:hypothetical protein [Patescibacteria group bacterium]